MKTKISFSATGCLLILLLLSMNGKSQTFSTAGTGSHADRYVINSDNSPFYSYLRLQVDNTKSWNIVNQNDLWWGFAANGDHNDRGSRKMTLTQDGKLGIGTSTPQGWLHVADIGSAGEKNLVIGDDVYFTDIDISDVIGLYGNANKNNAGLKLGENGIMLFGKNGKLGVGNTDPSATLHVGTTTGASIQMGDYGILRAESNNTIATNSHFVPTSDNERNLGSSALRWDVVWTANGTVQTSDRRDKENITEITYGMDEILQLRPVSFTWKDRPDNGTKLGLIAQEVDAVIDEVVKQDIKMDEEGNKYKVSDRYGLYYSDLIPVLIKAVQEEHAKVTELEERLAMLENGNMDPSSKSGDGTSANDILNGDLEKAELFQNVPNPFNIDTRIDYILPENVKSASLYIYNMNGQQIREISNLEPGKSSVTVEGATLEAGMYFYSLIADGQEVATKRMILTQ